MERVSSHRLDTNDFNKVYTECYSLGAYWEEIGVRLDAPRYIISNIEADRTSSSRRLSELLSQWLKRWSKDQVLPSWRVLCEAIAMVDRGTAEKIASRHQCSCSECYVPSEKPLKPTIEVKQTRREIKISPADLRRHHAQLCKVLNISENVLCSFADELFAMKIISNETKLSATRQGGQRGANVLLDHISMRIDLNPGLLPTVIDIMESIELLNEVVKQMRGEVDTTDTSKQQTKANQREETARTIAQPPSVTSEGVDSESELPVVPPVVDPPRPPDKQPDPEPPPPNRDQSTHENKQSWCSTKAIISLLILLIAVLIGSYLQKSYGQK